MQILETSGVLVDPVTLAPYMTMTIKFPFQQVRDDQSEHTQALEFYRAFNQAVTEWHANKATP